MTWIDPSTTASSDPTAPLVAADPAQVTSVPPLPPFSPHASTTSTGEVVTDTERSEPGLLGGLVGNWAGVGLNAIWTPSQQSATGNDRFLQLAATVETQEYLLLDGTIPNRGLNQPDLFMSGLRYTQQITSNNKALHFEHGVWLNVPATTVPPVGESVARMASIPHGTTINAQGTSTQMAAGSLVDIPVAGITPFAAGDPSSLSRLAEQDLAVETAFRTPDAPSNGFDQTTLDDVNSFLRAHVPAQPVAVSRIDVSTADTSILPGGGVANTAFLKPNAATTLVTATVWLFTMAAETQPSIMLYSQTVLLDFAGLSWPHITVGMLSRQAPVTAPQGAVS